MSITHFKHFLRILNSTLGHFRGIHRIIFRMLVKGFLFILSIITAFVALVVTVTSARQIGSCASVQLNTREHCQHLLNTHGLITIELTAILLASSPKRSDYINQWIYFRDTLNRDVGSLPTIFSLTKLYTQAPPFSDHTLTCSAYASFFFYFCIIQWLWLSVEKPKHQSFIPQIDWSS